MDLNDRRILVTGALGQIGSELVPASLDDSAARAEWGWAPAYDLEAMTTDMLERLSERLRNKLRDYRHAN